MVGTAVDRAGLTKLLEDFHTLTDIRISFWDTDEHKRVAGPIEGNSRFCSALRRIPEINENCCRCDRQALIAARRSRALHTFRVSRSTISHTLRANLGLSFVELVNRHRIEYVGRCLRQGDRVAAAARAAGYANPAYCSRVFCKINGVTPQYYRQFYQRDQEEEPT